MYMNRRLIMRLCWELPTRNFWNNVAEVNWDPGLLICSLFGFTYSGSSLWRVWTASRSLKSLICRRYLPGDGVFIWLIACLESVPNNGTWGGEWSTFGSSSTNEREWVTREAFIVWSPWIFNFYFYLLCTSGREAIDVCFFLYLQL